MFTVTSSPSNLPRLRGSLNKSIASSIVMVSILCVEFSPDETAKAIKRLLLKEKADLPNGRRSVFVCSECGDLGCGAITAVVDERGGTITWKDFGYENNYEDKIDLDKYGAIGPFTFNAKTYGQALLRVMDGLGRTSS